MTGFLGLATRRWYSGKLSPRLKAIVFYSLKATRELVPLMPSMSRARNWYHLWFR